jgi:hypothetical protein
MLPRPPHSTSPHHPTITSLLNNHFRSSTLFPKPVFQTNPTTFKMAFFKSLIIASVAAVALAQGETEKNTKVDVGSQSNGAHCGNGQKIACCNSGDDLIGINCLSIPISVFNPIFSPQDPSLIIIVVAIPIQQACGSNVAACCQTGDSEVSITLDILPLNSNS